MNPDDFPAPKEGFVITHFLVVSDQDRSRDFYQRIFDGKVLIERDPVIMKVANTWLILNVGGGPTDDKPTVRRPWRYAESALRASRAQGEISNVARHTRMALIRSTRKSTKTRTFALTFAPPGNSA
jgi:hypothetical protein